MINRDYYIKQIQEAFEVNPVCSIVGPRQCGKTTLAKLFASMQSSQVHIFDLENPQDASALASPSIALPPLEGLIIFDEIQQKPELFSYLRYLVDNSNKKFLILGSASQDLIRQSSETLAGRISTIELPPFQLYEVKDMHRHWLRGGFPKSFLASSDIQSEKWRLEYIKTFLERDLLMMGIETTPSNMRRLWSMIAHYHGDVLNVSELARSLTLNERTIKRYIDILEGCFMVRQLKPWHANISKRQIRRPKIYIRDSGLFHNLLGIPSKDIIRHPKYAASWEGYALETIIYTYDQGLSEFYFWRTEKGAELDLLVLHQGKRIGYEFKCSESPKITRSMNIALENLELDKIMIITPGEKSYPLNDRIFVKSINQYKDLNG